MHFCPHLCAPGKTSKKEGIPWWYEYSIKPIKALRQDVKMIAMTPDKTLPPSRGGFPHGRFGLTHQSMSLVPVTSHPSGERHNVCDGLYSPAGQDDGLQGRFASSPVCHIS
jgi:hypothetical protein